MRISDWSSDVCSSDLEMAARHEPCRSLVWYAAHAFDAVPNEASLVACHAKSHTAEVHRFVARTSTEVHGGMGFTDLLGLHYWFKRSEEHTSELKSLMRISYAVFCLKKQNTKTIE